MSNIVGFLEKLGQDSGLRYATDVEVESAMKRAGISPALQAAILNKDQRSLESLLGANTNVCCLVHQPKDPGDSFGNEDEEETERQDKQDKQEKSFQREAGRVA